MTQPPTFSFVIVLTLAAICGVSMTMFFLLVWRWTTQRQWVALTEWARARQMKVKLGGDQPLPEPLKPLSQRDGAPAPASASVRLRVEGAGVSVMQLETVPTDPALPSPQRWNLLVRKSPVSRPPAGLRPVTTPQGGSLLDQFDLAQFPSLKVGNRFTVLAGSSTAARALSDSASRTLLPPDIGLYVSGDSIVLDFSTRPFDPIELDRMRALSEQLIQML